MDLILGILIGVFLGIVLMAILIAAKWEDELHEKLVREEVLKIGSDSIFQKHGREIDEKMPSESPTKNPSHAEC